MHACCRAGPADPWDGTVREALQRREICSGSPAAAAAVPQMPCRSRYALLAAASASAPQKVLRAVRIIIPKRPPYPTREEREREWDRDAVRQGGRICLWPHRCFWPHHFEQAQVHWWTPRNILPAWIATPAKGWIANSCDTCMKY